MPALGVNIDYIASIRQAQGGKEPDPVHAAILAELAGAQRISAHLREDRRYIQDRDIYILKQVVTTGLTIKMAPTIEMMQLAIDVLPYMVTFVPEKHESTGNESGLPVREHERELSKNIESLQHNNILVSLFIDPDIQQIKSAKKVGATHIELHTGYYADASSTGRIEELEKLKDCVMAANKLGLRINAGYGLDYQNISAVVQIEHIDEIVVGHAIIARAALVGIEAAVRDFLALV